MTGDQGWGPPQSLLARLRWSFLLFSLFFVVTFLPQLTVDSPRPPLLQAAAVTSLAGLGVYYLRCYRRGRFPLPGMLLEATTFVLVVVTPDDPYKALGLLYIAVNFRALYGSWRHVLFFTTVAIVTFVGTVAAVAVAGGPDRVHLLAQSVPGVPVLALIAHLAAVACERGERAAARERVLSRSGSAIAVASEVEDVVREALAAVTDLTRGVPGVRAQVSRDGAPTADPSTDGDRLVMPLRARGADVGVLVVDSPTTLPLEVRDALEALASQLAMGLHSARLTADLRRRATHDPLTDLQNRAALDEHLGAALSGEHAPRLAILLLDLDGFKMVNDTAGHHAGDTVLVTTARRLLAVAGEEDMVVRLGGDEFVLVLHGPDPVAEAARLKPLISAELARPVLLDDGTRVAVGTSIGVAVASPGRSPDELLRAADAGMYAEKSASRRCRPGSGPPLQRAATTA